MWSSSVLLAGMQLDDSLPPPSEQSTGLAASNGSEASCKQAVVSCTKEEENGDKIACKILPASYSKSLPRPTPSILAQCIANIFQVPAESNAFKAEM